jgi:hypothetical protein
MSGHPASIPFVATDLTILQVASVPAEAPDMVSGGRVYRRLDPTYYAWLRSRMEMAASACQRQRLSQTAFDGLRVRFNLVHDQALALFGESVLLEAFQGFDPKSYRWPGQDPPAPAPAQPQPAEIPEARPTPPEASLPPRCSPAMPSRPGGHAQPGRKAGHVHPVEEVPGLTFNQAVTEHALAEVDRIRDEALAKGWTMDELYQTRGRFAFPCGRDYGIVCFIANDQRLGKVTEESIELICKAGHALRFYRRNTP